MHFSQYNCRKLSNARPAEYQGNGILERNTKDKDFYLGAIVPNFLFGLT